MSTTTFRKLEGFSPCLAIVVAFALASFSVITPISAEDYKDARKRVDHLLKSANAGDRVQGIVQLAQSGDSKAVDDVLSYMEKEEDPGAALEMGKALKHLTSDDCIKEIRKTALKYQGGPKIFCAYWAFLGVAAGRSTGGDALLKDAVGDAKSRQDAFIRAAALEAIGANERGDLHGIVEEILKTYNKDWEEEFSIVPICASFAAGRIGNADNRLTLVSALADVLEKYQNKRIQHFAADACAKITGEKPFVESSYWRAWVASNGQMSGAEGDKTFAKPKTPTFFGSQAVGNRIVFVIDISGSMAEPVKVAGLPKPPEPEPEPKGPETGGKNDKDKDKNKPKKKPVPPPDYSGVSRKIDLAKVELVYAIQQLDEDYFFNVVVYDTNHEYLLGSGAFSKATEANKAKFIAQVKSFEPREMTNIHGALKRAYKVTDKGECKNDPAWDGIALAYGASTIFFLTDGMPTWSDDTTDRIPNSPMGNGKYVNAQLIFNDISRMNTFRKSVIHTVGIGEHERTLLKALADMSGGTYRDLSGV